MAVSKVILNGTTLIDTTDKTVTNASMLSGVTALKNDGTTATGNIASKTSSDLTVSGATVTAPAGYYAAAASKSVSSMTLPSSLAIAPTTGYTKKLTIDRQTGTRYINIAAGYNSTPSYYEISAVNDGTAGTPTATKGTVSNHSVSVTPSVTNTTGYISGGTKNGTAVTVRASELVSGTKSITENGTGIDVTNYAAVDVAVESGGASDYTLVASSEVTVSKTDNTGELVTTINLPDRSTSAMYYVKIRDKAGKRTGYFFGADQWFIDLAMANGSTENLTYRPSISYGVNSDGAFYYGSSSVVANNGFGVYASSISTTTAPSGAIISRLNIYTRYSSYLGTINGTFSIEVYKLKWPDDISPLA